MFIKQYSNPKLFTVIQDDVVNWLQTGGTEADLYYFDPPWAGRDHVNQDKVPLRLGLYTIGQMVNTVIQDDVVNWLQTGGTEADLYYFDPPWGGRDYVNQDKVLLRLGLYTIGQMVNCIFEQNLTSNSIISNNFDDFEVDVKLAYDIYDVMTTYDRVSLKLVHIAK